MIFRVGLYVLGGGTEYVFMQTVLWGGAPRVSGAAMWLASHPKLHSAGSAEPSTEQ